MKVAVRALTAVLLVPVAVVGFAAAFGLASVAGAGGHQSTDPPPTSTEPPPTETETTPPPSPRRPTIRPGVTIAGIPVEGLTRYEAAGVVRERFREPLAIVVEPGRTLRVSPVELGARADVAAAVSRAQFARPGARVPLKVRVPKARVERFVTRLGRGVDRKPVDARQRLSGATIRVTPAKEGRRLQRIAGVRDIRGALLKHSRGPVALTYSPVRAKVTERDLGPAVIILRESKRLRYFENGKLKKVFGVATGQSSFPTPIGAFEITTMQRNPWWYPPPSGWAAGKSPVPPGPGNPLGTRWMGISSPYVGIHGTPDAASIGYSASHGCVRMRIPDAEWLFERVEVGTPVFIVRR